MGFDFEELRPTQRFADAYRDADGRLRRETRKTTRLLLENPGHPGLRLKPIQPDKVYWEARLNRGDRLILRPTGNAAYLIDIVHHDEIDRYGRA